jgi:small subunit ribosomal protein S6
MHNRNYEVLYIAHPNLKPDDLTRVIEKFKKIAEDNGAIISRAELWEKRKLAYEINKLKEGNYIIMNFEAPATAPAELNRLMRISDDVIRHTILLDEGSKVPADAKPKSEGPKAEALAAVSTETVEA